MKHLITLLTIALAGCATTQSSSLPRDYLGPIVRVHETVNGEGSANIEMYVIKSVDGVEVFNGITESQKASRGRGFVLTVQSQVHRIPLRPTKLVLRGSHVKAAPIQELTERASGTFREVEGVISFIPQEGKDYVVNGKLASKPASIWIEEYGTGKRVTDVIESRQ